MARTKAATAAVVAAELEELLDHGPVLALEVAGAAVDRHLVGALRDLDAQAARGSVCAAPSDPRATPDSVTARPPPGGGRGRRRRRWCRRRRTRAVPRDEQDALVRADVDGQRHVHRREDDGVVEGDEEK
jgi:hypothetical protein